MKLVKYLSAVALVSASAFSQAAVMDFWATDGWNMIASEDKTGDFDRVSPGLGGQDFDAEYLFYRYDQQTNVLSLGLQTGFDMLDGHVFHEGQDFYAGDLAVGFNGAGLNYAVDFGLYTKDFTTDTSRWHYDPTEVNSSAGANGVDPEGFYSVSEWNNNITYPESVPFAMDEGSLVTGLLSNEAGQQGDSYFRTVSFDLSSLGLGDTFELSTHWTMSCGNDVVAATVNVPEPNSIYLFALGLLALAGVRRIKKA